MKKIFNILVVSSALILAACGGSSDSSGNNSEPFGLGAYKQCSIANGFVLIPSVFGCKTSHPSLNKGQVFALKCSQVSISASPEGAQYRIEVIGAESADIQSVVNDINKEGNGSILKYSCS